MFVNEMARKLCSEYVGGGYWNYYELNNGAWYMSLDDERMFHVVWADNDFESEMSADAFSITSCLLACHIMLNARSELFLPAYYLLREYATEHAEKELILAVVD